MRKRTKRRGHATIYNGIRFRSRLEARWAAFFDLLGWPYTYEPPIPLDHYIPDFVLDYGGVVECKPFLTLSSPEISSAVAKMQTAGYDDDAIIVGAKLFTGPKGHAIIGLSNPYPLNPSVFVSTCLVRSEGSWVPSTRVDEELTKSERIVQTWVRHLWNEAGNAIQWRKPHVKRPNP